MDELIFILSQPDPDTGAVKVVTLTHVPDNWDNTAIQWERSLKYWGLARSFTMPLKWVKEGAKLIRDAYYSDGAQAYVQVTVKKLDKLTLTYMVVFTGEIDFKTFRDYDFYCEANMIDGGLWKIIKEASKNEYTIPYYKFEIPSERDTFIAAPGSPWMGGETIYSMRPLTVFKWLVDKMTNGAVKAGTYGVKSTLLDAGGYWYDKLLMNNGKAWRLITVLDSSFPDEQVQELKTSLDDFFQSLCALGINAGIGIEVINNKPTVVLEDFAYFFKNSVFINVGEVKEINVSWIDEFCINKVKMLYPDKEIEDASYTITEPNSWSAWRQRDHKFAKNDVLQLESKYRADWAGLQVIYNERIPDTNDGWDDDIWFCEVEPFIVPGKVDAYRLKQGYIKQKLPSGFSNPIAWFNCLFSPAHNFIRAKTLIDQYMYRLTGYWFEFTSGGYFQRYNATRSYYDDPGILTDGVVREYGDRTIGGDKVFKPFEITFEAPYDGRYIDLANRFYEYVVRFKYKGVEYDGYFKKMEINLSGRGSAKFSLICHEQTNITKLIR